MKCVWLQTARAGSGTWGHGLGKGRGDMKKRNPAVDYAMIVAGTFLIG